MADADTQRKILFSAQKNEGPFIIEWVAYHQVVGFTDIVIVSNDCNDGSDDLLDQLAAQGHLTHLRQTVPPNERPQLHAAKTALEQGVFRNGDWVMWLDIDEYLFVKAGNGTIDDLVDANPGADAIAVPWQIFGDSNRDWAGRQISSAYTRTSKKGWHQNRQVKTLYRHTEKIERMDIHRPVFNDGLGADDISFVDSGNRPVPENFFGSFFKDGSPRHRLDVAGRSYANAQINHYSIRGRRPFAAKIARGNGYIALDEVGQSEAATVQTAHQSQEYYEKYNRNEREDRKILKHSVATYRQSENLLDDLRPNRPRPALSVHTETHRCKLSYDAYELVIEFLTGRKIAPTNSTERPALTLGDNSPAANSILWGAGLPNTDAELAQSLDIRAVRGKLSAEKLHQQGLDVPEVFGDPLLLLPQALPIERKQSASGTAICAETRHVDDFAKFSQPEIEIVDQGGTGTDAVEKIATAKTCISTTLFGALVAQAYGVPWVWLRLDGSIDATTEFAFHDFLTLLDEKDVRAIDSDLDTLTALELDAMSDTARLPKVNIDLNQLLYAFPFDVVESPIP